MAKKKIPGVAYWQIIDAIEGAKPVGKAWLDWQREYVKANGLYLGDVNFKSGLISELKNGMAVPTKHMEQADIDAGHEVMDKVSEANDEIEHLIQVVARRYGIRPHQIELKTGEVTPMDYETLEEIKEEEDVEDTDRPVKPE